MTGLDEVKAPLDDGTERNAGKAGGGGRTGGLRYFIA